MKEIVKLAIALAEERASRRAGRSMARIVGIVTLCGLASLCALAALACALTALWLYAMERVGPVEAPLIVAAVLLALSVMSLVFLRNALARRQDINRAEREALVDSLIAEATVLVRENKMPVMIAAIIAGLFVGSDRK